MPRPAFAQALLAALALPHPAPAASPHDGTYKGTYRTIRNDNSGACDKLDSDRVSITVTDGKFTRRWAGNPIEVTVAADGAVSGSGNNRLAKRPDGGDNNRAISFIGRIANGVMEGEYGHARCAVRFNLRKEGP
jgi:hypothetical protein